jgi:hypothetical protein
MPNLSMTDSMTALEVMRRANNQDGFHIVELMAQTNEILKDMPMIEANDGTIHNTLVRTSLRSGTHRKYNEGIAPGATTTDTIRDRITMLEDYSIVDKDLADHSGNVKALRASEADAFLQGMGQTQAEELIYGDHGRNEAEINGLAVRLNKLTDKNVMNAGGSSNKCTSIYVCAIGNRFAHLIYPRGRKDCGIKTEDMGLQNWPMEKGKVMPAYVQFFSTHYGLSIAHPDAVKRICNIDNTVPGDKIVEMILEAMLRLPQGAQGVSIYCNQDILVKIDKAAWSKGNAVFTKEDPWGDMITHIRSGRCRRVDAILSTEQALV